MTNTTYYERDKRLRFFHDPRPLVAAFHLFMAAGGLDLDINACRQTQLVKRFDGFRRRLHDIDQPLERANLELLAGLLVDVRARQDGIAFNPRRQGNWSVDDGTRPLGRIHDLHRTLIQDRVIVCFHPDANDFVALSGHGCPPGEFLLREQEELPSCDLQ